MWTFMEDVAYVAFLLKNWRVMLNDNMTVDGGMWSFQIAPPNVGKSRMHSCLGCSKYACY